MLYFLNVRIKILYRARFLDIEQMVKRELRDAERVYVNGILQNGLESGNNKPFWKYVMSPKQETFDISALKSNGNDMYYM